MAALQPRNTTAYKNRKWLTQAKGWSNKYQKCKGKDKGKGHPRTSHEGPEGE